MRGHGKDEEICVLTLQLARPVVTRAAEKETQNRVIRLICPFLPPRVFVKCPSIRKMDGRGGGDRIHQRHGNKGVLRRSLAFKGIERKDEEFLVPPYCPFGINRRFTVLRRTVGPEPDSMPY